MEQLHTARQLLSRVGWLAEVPKDFADTVLSNCRLLILEKGSTVYRVGEPPDGLYGLAKGACAMDMAPNEIGPNPLHIARPGTWLGGTSSRTRSCKIGQCNRDAAKPLPLPSELRVGTYRGKRSQRMAMVGCPGGDPFQKHARGAGRSRNTQTAPKDRGDTASTCWQRVGPDPGPRPDTERPCSTFKSFAGGARRSP